MDMHHLERETTAVVHIGEDDLPALARGCAVLGTGGGGSVETGLLLAGRAVRERGPVQVVQLAGLADDAFFFQVAGTGEPSARPQLVALPDGLPGLRDEGAGV